MAPPVNTSARQRLEAQLRRDAFLAFAKVFTCGLLTGAGLVAAVWFASL